MLRRPSIRSTVTTVAAACILVGGANLASYATTGKVLGLGSGHHAAGTAGAGSGAATSQKTIVFHLGAVGKKFNAGTAHLLKSKVPTGTYQVGMSGTLIDTGSTGSDSYSCLIGDKNDTTRVLGGTSSNIKRIYALDGDAQGNFKFGVLANTNHVQKVDRAKIVFGCIFNGDGKFVEKRTLTFTFKPVKATNKSASPINIVPRSGVRKLSSLLH
jgi:hypothetical protein